MSKTNKYLEFAKGAKAQEALEAGAHTVGGDEHIAEHLMPMAKRGTVANDIASVIKDLTGKQEIKSDKAGVVHLELERCVKTIQRRFNFNY
ncbi:50S ribosomal protein L1 [Gigaspora margarita]|uniref:50S ribosomal protein L1 n=1 Tax=Gigaspora margarita TaxID=4874 RepID=A0A8H4AX80_GIGMA|nr:50S ribosomal protein L1 [Gigaspora margarita]